MSEQTRGRPNADGPGVKLPGSGDFEVAAQCFPATGGTATGDFADLFPTGRGRWVAVLGDVCGKGSRAARVAHRAGSAIRAVAAVDDSPRVILAHLNRVLLRSGYGSAASLTAICLRLERGTPGLAVTLCVAGHPPALLRAGDGSVTEIAATGTMLGVLGDPLLVDHDFALLPSSTLLLYSDGVTEARRGQEYYADRLFDFMAREGHHRLASIPERVVSEVRAFSGGTNADDLAVLALRATGSIVTPGTHGGTTPTAA